MCLAQVNEFLKASKCPLLCGSKVPEMVMVMAQETSGEPQ